MGKKNIDAPISKVNHACPSIDNGVHSPIGNKIHKTVDSRVRILCTSAGYISAEVRPNPTVGSIEGPDEATSPANCASQYAAFRLPKEALGSSSINEMVASLRNLQLGKVKSQPTSQNVQIGSPCFGSLRGSVLRPGFCSLPSTPTQVPTCPGASCFDLWDQTCEEEPVLERVESGRDIRAKMFEKLSKENSLDRSSPSTSGGAPDVGWVSELGSEGEPCGSASAVSR